MPTRPASGGILQAPFPIAPLADEPTDLVEGIHQARLRRRNAVGGEHRGQQSLVGSQPDGRRRNERPNAIGPGRILDVEQVIELPGLGRHVDTQGCGELERQRLKRPGTTPAS